MFSTLPLLKITVACNLNIFKISNPFFDFEEKMSSNEFEQRLNMVMGASKDIILADPDEPQIAKTSTMDRIC